MCILENRDVCATYLWLDPPVKKSAQNLDGISHSNVLSEYLKFVEKYQLSDSKEQFSFVVDEFSELVHTRNLPCSLDLPVRKTQNLDTISYSVCF